MSPRVLAIAVLAWTALSWGGRVGLLTEAEAGDAFTLLRVLGSIGISLVTAAALWWRPPWDRAVGWVFASWSAAVWARAVVVTWLDPPSLAFGLVHTVLAIGWFVLAWLVLRDARRPAEP